MRIAFRPSETDAKLVVDTNTVLPGPGPLESLQPVSRERRKIREAARLMKLIKLTTSGSLNGLKPFTGFVVKEFPRFRIPEGTNHTFSV
jgi:hypothetical protein